MAFNRRVGNGLEAELELPAGEFELVARQEIAAGKRGLMEVAIAMGMDMDKDMGVVVKLVSERRRWWSPLIFEVCPSYSAFLMY